MEPLKQAWHDLPAARTSPAALRGMIHRHPARRGMRRQMILEIISLGLFLGVYYDFFDGAKRPWHINALLLAAVGFVIVQNVAGYIFSRRALEGDHLQDMVQRHIRGMQAFAVVSVVSRVGMVICLLVFFCFGIVMTDSKIWMLVVISVVAAAQMIWLGAIWRKRIHALRSSLEG